MRTKFTARERAKIKTVLAEYATFVNKIVADSGERYNNEFGCGNCGDMDPVYTTLSNLRDMFDGKEVPHARP